MKKGLLLVSIILASKASFGQLTQTNEPAVGASSQMYLVDATGVNVSGIAGTGVEWDYRNAVISLNDTETVSVAAAAATTNGSSFPASTKAITQGVILQYFNSSSTERVSQGFVFNEPTLGEIVVTFDTDEATVLTYPFEYGSTLSDAYAGSADTPLGASPVTGNINATIDGTGTLRLPGDDFANVFRLATHDTTVAVTLLGTIEIIRTQYEYYDLADQDLPIFLDVTIFISGMGEQRQVLSKNYSTLGLNKNSIENVVLYPNPSNGNFTISGEFVKGMVEVTDLTGRVVYSSEVASGSAVELNDVKSGIYTVKLSANDKTSIQKITIK